MERPLDPVGADFGPIGKELGRRAKLRQLVRPYTAVVTIEEYPGKKITGTFLNLN